MAKKLVHGNSSYDLLVDLIFKLSPYQADRLYSELKPRYSKRHKTHIYNSDGLEDKENGKVRLMESQYKSLRVEYGDTYIKRAFTELTNYITFLEQNLDKDSSYKTKLAKLNKGTHNLLLTEGWVHNKCKQWIVKDRPQVLNLNPYMIEDFGTAREYIKSIPKEMREYAMDVQSLLLKFPELKGEEV